MNHHSLYCCIVLLLTITSLFSQGSLSVSQKQATVSFFRYQSIIDSFFLIVKQRNPLLKAANAQIDAARQNIIKANSFEPPQLGLEFNNSPLMEFPAKPMDITVSLEQMFMFPGKRSAMAFAESQRVAMNQFESYMQEESLKKKLKNAFAELYYVWRKKEIIRENILLVYSFDKIATKQYEVGMGIQADIFRAKTELAGLRRDSIQNEQTISSMTAMLNALMNQPVDLPIRKIDWIDVPVFTRTIEQLCTLAQRNRPDLRSMQANIAMLNAEIKVAKKAYYPDFTVKGMYMNAVESKDDNLSVMFGVTIPVAPWSYKKYSTDYSLKQYAVVIAQHQYDDMKNMIYAQIQDALTRVASNNEQLKIALKHTIPYADQTLNATMTAYSNGKTEFLMLIDAQRMILMAHMDHHMAIMGLLQSIAELEQAVGLSLDQIQLSISSREK